MQNTERKAVWLDCDPGHDDAFALILAGFDPTLRLLGVSTTHGNSPVLNTTKNALAILHAAGLGHVPVVAGASKPLTREALPCPDIHGECGLATFGDVQLPPAPVTAQAVESKAVNFCFTALHAYYTQRKSKATIIATGPLTNIALLLSVYPEVRDIIAGIVFMGGAIGVGNTRPSSEFNIELDPEAAHIVFSSGVLVTMVPLEVTHTALATVAVLDKVAHGGRPVLQHDECAMPAMPATAARGSEPPGNEPSKALSFEVEPVSSTIPHVPGATPFRRLCCSLLRYFAHSYRSQFAMAAPPLHDPCAVFYVICPEAFTSQRCAVAVEMSSALTYGRTVVDVYGVGAGLGKVPKQTEAEKNVNVCLKMDVPAFWARMLHAIAAADTVSPLNDVALPIDAPQPVIDASATTSLWPSAQSASPSRTPSSRHGPGSPGGFGVGTYRATARALWVGVQSDGHVSQAASPAQISGPGVSEPVPQFP